VDNKNQQQDIELVKVKSEVHALKSLLEDFISNHFSHLRDKVDWIFKITITTLVGIIIKLLFF